MAKSMRCPKCKSTNIQVFCQDCEYRWKVK